MAEPKFVIQGVDYPVAAWDTFDMGEAEILTSKTGLTLIDLTQGNIPLTPGLVATMMIVSYMRQNPNATRATAESIVSKVKLLDALEHIAEDADADPPSQTPSETKPPGEPEKNDDSTTSTGNDGSQGSDDPQVVHQLPTGTPKLPTSDTYDHVTSLP